MPHSSICNWPLSRAATWLGPVLAPPVTLKVVPVWAIKLYGYPVIKDLGGSPGHGFLCSAFPLSVSWTHVE